MKKYSEPEEWKNGAQISVRNYIEVNGLWPITELHKNAASVQAKIVEDAELSDY
jgi:hypothetical protein